MLRIHRSVQFLASTPAPIRGGRSSAVSLSLISLSVYMRTFQTAFSERKTSHGHARIALVFNTTASESPAISWQARSDARPLQRSRNLISALSCLAFSLSPSDFCTHDKLFYTSVSEGKRLSPGVKHEQDAWKACSWSLLPFVKNSSAYLHLRVSLHCILLIHMERELWLLWNWTSPFHSIIFIFFQLSLKVRLYG